MESNSKPGRIQCSEVSAAMLVKERRTSQYIDPFKVVRRGEVKIKGKGELMLYWVKARGGDSELFDDEEEEVDRILEPNMLLGGAEMLEPIMEHPSRELSASGSNSARRLSASISDGLRKSLKFVNAQTLWTQAADDKLATEERESAKSSSELY